MATMQEIEKCAATLAAARDALTAEWLAEKEDLAEIERRHLAAIRRLTAAFRGASDVVAKAVAESPGLFAKPKSVILHGIRLGYRKGTGKMGWEDDDVLVKAIRKQLPDLADLLIQKTEKPLKGPLGELPADALKKLGVTIEDTSDVAFVALADGDTQKMIKALLKKQSEETEG